MSAEDRLRDLLRSEATTIVPTGDGLARIQQRIARRRRLRFWVFPSAAVATAAAVAAFVLIAPDGPKTQTLTPGGTPTSQVPVPPGSYTGPAIWPYASQAEADSWSMASTVFDMLDSKVVTEHFVSDYLGLTGITVTQSCVSCEVLGLEVGGKQVGEVSVAHYVVGPQHSHVFTVVGVTGGDLTITSPKAGAAITSPTSVTGRITGVDEHVALQLLDASGAQLAQGGAQAGSAVPWSDTLTWTRSDWTHGSVVGVTRSPKDGAVNRVVAVPVTRATGATTASFAGLVDGHVSLFDAATGKLVRQLTYPPQGKSDTAATWSDDTLVWVRTSGASACVNELDRLDGTKASTIATSTAVRYEWPVLSPSKQWLSWVETPCSGSTSGELVIAHQDTVQRMPLPSGSLTELYDVDDRGALLLRTNDAHTTGAGTLGLLQTGATSLDTAKALEAEPGCTLYAGATFDGDEPVAFESCGSTIALVRFDAHGVQTGVDPKHTAHPVAQSLSMLDGHLLVAQGMYGRDTGGPIQLYQDGDFVTLIPNDGCVTSQYFKGCVISADW